MSRSEQPAVVSGDGNSPLLQHTAYNQPSVFQPANLLREARRQKQLPDLPVPRVCLLDPDGDIVRHLAAGIGRRHPGWACYHTDMWVTDVHGAGPHGDVDGELGVVGMAVGAPFAVLVAEQLHASGADLVLSITSAGQLTALADPPYFVLIDRARRDEGTSAHYQPPGAWSHLPRHLARAASAALAGFHQPVFAGTSWTTDAPYRETAADLARARDSGCVCVEMEAAALYAYAAARHRDVVCLAHVTNTMAVSGDDFDKGEADGALASLRVASLLARHLTTTIEADHAVN
jgi:purine-nucleoside phosphorylase